MGSTVFTTASRESRCRSAKKDGNGRSRGDRLGSSSLFFSFSSFYCCKISIEGSKPNL